MCLGLGLISFFLGLFGLKGWGPAEALTERMVLFGGQQAFDSICIPSVSADGLA